MKYTIYLILLLISLISGQYSQSIIPQNSLYFRNTSTTDAGNTIILSSILVISPTLVIEDKKAFFGLSKELSIGKFPYGRAELDYTYIFRSERTSALHLSYNLDIPFNGNFKQSSLFMISPGAGYYTDFTRKGFFVQAAIGAFASTGFSENISIHPNIKFRKIFMKDDLPGAFEISLGVGFGFYNR